VGKGGRWEAGIGLTGEIELVGICVATKMNIIFTENVAKGVEVNDGEKTPQNRTLEHTSGLRSERLELAAWPEG